LDGNIVVLAYEISVIQGTVDVSNKVSQNELVETLDFCSAAFDETQPEIKSAVLQKISSDGVDIMGQKLNTRGILTQTTEAYQNNFTAEELRAIEHIRARNAMGTQRTFDLDNFGTDVINGMRLNLQRGTLGLVKMADLPLMSKI